MGDYDYAEQKPFSPLAPGGKSWWFVVLVALLAAVAGICSIVATAHTEWVVSDMPRTVPERTVGIWRICGFKNSQGQFVDDCTDIISATSASCPDNTHTFRALQALSIIAIVSLFLTVCFTPYGAVNGSLPVLTVACLLSYLALAASTAILFVFGFEVKKDWACQNPKASGEAILDFDWGSCFWIQLGATPVAATAALLLSILLIVAYRYRLPGVRYSFPQQQQAPGPVQYYHPSNNGDIKASPYQQFSGVAAPNTTVPPVTVPVATTVGGPAFGHPLSYYATAPSIYSPPNFNYNTAPQQGYYPIQTSSYLSPLTQVIPTGAPDAAASFPFVATSFGTYPNPRTTTTTYYYDSSIYASPNYSHDNPPQNETRDDWLPQEAYNTVTQQVYYY